MHVSRHVKRPFHVVVSTQMLHQHRNMEQHIEVFFEVRPQGIKGRRSSVHVPVFDVVHGRHDLLIDLRRSPGFRFRPRPDTIVMLSLSHRFGPPFGLCGSGIRLDVG